MQHALSALYCFLTTDHQQKASETPQYKTSTEECRQKALFQFMIIFDHTCFFCFGCYMLIHVTALTSLLASFFPSTSVSENFPWWPAAKKDEDLEEHATSWSTTPAVIFYEDGIQKKLLHYEKCQQDQENHVGI